MTWILYLIVIFLSFSDFPQLLYSVLSMKIPYIFNWKSFFPQDECGQFPYDANIQIHWVSFLDGRQRVLLFTDDVALVSKALQAEEMEQADLEVALSLHSLGLSLVNNENKQEVSYVGVTRYIQREIRCMSL